MAKGIGNVFVSISAKTAKFEAKLASASKKLRKFGRNATSIGKSVGLGLGAPLTAMGGVALNTFQSFEQGMAKVKAISGATDTQFKALKDSAESLGTTTRFTASEVSNLQLNFSKLGLNPEEINKVTKATLNLALATGEDLANSATVGASVMKGFNLDASEMGRITDVMAMSFSSSALDLEKFSVAMANAQVNARLAGFSLEETSAMLSVIVDTGTDASKAGTDLRSIFIELNKKGISLAEAFHRINTAETDNEKSALAVELANKRAGASLVSLAENSDRLQELTAKYENARGASQDMANIMDNTLQGSLFKLRSAVEAVQIRFGELAEKHVRPLVDRIAEFVSTNKEAIAQFLKIATPIALVATLLAGMVFVAGQLAFAFVALKPILAIIAGIAGVVSLKFILIAGAIAGIIYIAHKLGFLQTLFENIQFAIKAMALMAVDAFEAFKTHILPKIVNFIDNARNFFVGLANSVATIFTNIRNVISGILLKIIKFFTDKIVALANKFPMFFGKVGDGIKALTDKFEDAKAPVVEYFSSIADEVNDSTEETVLNLEGLTQKVDEVKQKLSGGQGDDGSPFDPEAGGGLLGNMVEEAVKALKELGKKTNDVGTEMKAIMKNVSDGMTNSIQEFVNTGKANFKDLVRDILGQIQKLMIQKAIVDPLLNTFTSTFFPTPKNMGGFVKAGKPYLVGESGTEMFVPRQSGKIIPNHKMGGEGVVVNFNVQATDANSFDSQIAQRKNLIVGIVNDAFNRQGKQGI
tara:strand:- start:8270 stop:10540 length:2271 start_codon:yes stop_codon:yes gene_type:complete